MARFLIAVLLAFGVWLAITRGPTFMSDHGYLNAPGVRHLGDDGKIH